MKYTKIITFILCFSALFVTSCNREEKGDGKENPVTKDLAITTEAPVTKTETEEPEKDPDDTTETGIKKDAIDNPKSNKHALIAAVDAGPLATADKELPIRVARDMAKYITKLVSTYKGQYSSTLPASGDAVWNEKRVATSGGANATLVCSVDKVERKSTPIRPGSEIVATVTLKAFDVNGDNFWTKTMTGACLNEKMPKLIGPANTPSSRAVWKAAKKCILLFCKHLEYKNATSPDDADDPAIKKLKLVDIPFNSVPPNADILVNGIFRGTTPTVIPLAVKKEVEIIIERTGYEAWKRTITIEKNMKVEPALTPKK